MSIHCSTVRKSKIHKTILLIISLIWKLINIMNHDAYLKIKCDKT